MLGSLYCWRLMSCFKSLLWKYRMKIIFFCLNCGNVLISNIFLFFFMKVELGGLDNFLRFFYIVINIVII